VERIARRGVKRSPPFRMPRRCPACGTGAEASGPLTCCPNRFGCPAQLTGRLVHFASPEALDIEGLGEETVRQLVERELVREPADLYGLEPDDLEGLPHFGHKSAQKLVRAIGGSRHSPLRRLLVGLGIPGVGPAVARRLADRFPDLSGLMAATASELAGVPGIGSVLAAQIHSFLADRRNRRAIDRLIERGVRPIRGTRQAGRLAGRRFVFTGTLDRYTRKQAERLVESLGGSVSSTVSGRTDFVIVGADPGQKLDDAREHNVKQLTEKAFLTLVRRAGGEV